MWDGGFAHCEARVYFAVKQEHAHAPFRQDGCHDRAGHAAAQDGYIKIMCGFLEDHGQSGQCWINAAPQENPAPLVVSMTRSPSLMWPSSMASM